VLIPRPETECLVEAAIDFIAVKASGAPRRILDLGTGSGAIVVALASQEPRHLYFASDRFPSAVELARRNADRHRLRDIIHFWVGDWLTPLRQIRPGFDMIISNPPYIPTVAIDRLQPEIHRYEPIAALNGSADGLECYHEMIKTAHHFLNPGGMLLLEIGHDQRADIQEIVNRVDRYRNFNCSKDYSGYDRVVSMRKRE
jgi:release factor glutamine methyltransferase